MIMDIAGINAPPGIDYKLFLHLLQRYIDTAPINNYNFGRLAPIGDWLDKLAAQFEKDFGDSL